MLSPELFVIVVTGFGHSYGMDQKLKQEFAGSDRYAVTNFMKYSGPDDVELRQQIRADEEKFAPVGNHGLIGFEVDSQNMALVPEIIAQAIAEKSKLKSQKLEQKNKSDSSTWVEKLGLAPLDVRRMRDDPTQGRS